MKILLSSSNRLNKWLKLDLPRIPSPDGKRVGTQPLITNDETISWQCHVVSNRYGGDRYTVIAVEAYSRFTLLLPFDFAPTQAELEQKICQRWTQELVSLMIKHGAVARADSLRVFDHIYHQLLNIEWWRNTDLSVNGHVSDAEQWVTQTIADRGMDALSEEEALDLAYHINSFFKRAKNSQGKKQQFYPIPRFVDYGLVRFMPDSGGYQDDVSGSTQSSDENKVVSMAEYRAGKVKS